MFRSIVIVFIAGWVGWFWMDKRMFGRAMPMGRGGGDILMDFQMAFDLVKQGEIAGAFTFIWPAHFIVLSLVGGVLVSMVAASVRRGFARRRAGMQMPQRERKPPGQGDEPERR